MASGCAGKGGGAALSGSTGSGSAPPEEPPRCPAPPRALLQRSEHPCSSPGIVPSRPLRCAGTAVPGRGRGAAAGALGELLCIRGAAQDGPCGPRGTPEPPTRRCWRLGGCGAPGATAGSPQVDIGSAAAAARYRFPSRTWNKLEVLKNSSGSN